MSSKREPLAITLAEACELLSLRDRQTIKAYAQQGRVRIVGVGVGQRVVLESIHEYLRGESAWHARRQSSNPDASQEPAVSATRRTGGRSRMKRSFRQDQELTGTITFLPTVKPRRMKQDSQPNQANMDVKPFQPAFKRKGKK